MPRRDPPTRGGGSEKQEGPIGLGLLAGGENVAQHFVASYVQGEAQVDATDMTASTTSDTGTAYHDPIFAAAPIVEPKSPKLTPQAARVTFVVKKT